MSDRYADGRRKAQQREADLKYRAKQREQRQYLRDVCSALGLSPESFINRHNAESVAALIRAGMEDHAH